VKLNNKENNIPGFLPPEKFEVQLSPKDGSIFLRKPGFNTHAATINANIIMAGCLVLSGRLYANVSQEYCHKCYITARKQTKHICIAVSNALDM